MDVIEHHLNYCRRTNQFWNKLKSWMLAKVGFGMELTVCEVMFGLPTHNNSDLKLFLIHIGKWFLNNAKRQNKPLYL